MTGKHDQIAGSLIQDILSGQYRVSERLPSERDLATRFDANRGAVREAMKKLEQIGLAQVQPGGARVRPTDEASLDVIGHLLTQGKLPDATLVDQIMVVLNSLISVAALQTLELASDEEINEIRKLARPLIDEDLDQGAHTLARFELMESIMQASRNLPLRLIARTLFDQVAPNLTELHPFAIVDNEKHRIVAKQLDRDLEHRDAYGLRDTFAAFLDLNRETMMRASDAARLAAGQEAITP
ncbi:GntR family transcriptional regulator [Pseudomonadales bacterium]|jgi:DNA-binding FadR family transcriptional regulator|nr:FadR family transcriptional regulator [Gammaproteobacteria bacterium]MDA7753941.1 GntR family transcriptional regulator [Pseudomonadales bacterium]MBT3710051.1 FadR family transcriptional regulator [Gammaproteobacteria bacterium]MBT3734849.1 FadR family transcriptional regulator [Gammaproteobacteria bacterium]MBT3900816.1 FadR family transcriptional regulator [Gammaproteobacteria bacterium]|tara:strand:+ start:73 stop:795 length:723 start_codon:yes stop_codon:yes gene_type:complete